MPSTRVPLLICSIGNPISNPSYANTLHSAGHTAVLAVHNLLLRAGYEFTNFVREKSFGNGLVSRPLIGRRLTWSGIKKGSPAGIENASQRTVVEDDWALWMSNSLMNVSGKGVAEAFKRFKWEIAAEPDREAASRAQLVVLHDEMEKPLGSIAVKKGGASLKGHNGLKSIQQALGGQSFVRIGIGIGRPESRDPDTVSQYVLRKMTRGEQSAVDRTAPDVLEALREIAEGT